MSTYEKTDGEVALEWVNAHWTGDCEACGHADWGASDKAMRIRTDDSRSFMPLVGIVCTHCANTRLLNMVMVRAKLEEGPA